MSDDVRPDDLVRSPSGRVPKWVLDEARGIKTEPVPFRAHPTPPGRPPRSKGKWRDRLIIALVIAVVGSYGIYSATQGKDAQPVAEHQSTPSQPREVPTAGHDEESRRLLPAPSAGTSSSYRFLVHQKDRVTPVTWSPCRPIHYVVRPDYSPDQGGALLAEAFAQLSGATGLRFIDDGGTTEAPAEDRPSYQPKVYGDRWAPVLVVWATPDEVPDFGVDIAGEATSVPAYTADRSLTYVTGTVALDARRLASLTTTPRGAAFARSVILHELGHLVGLAHVNAGTQVMSPRGVVSTYQEGDLAGLAELGKGPCQPSV